ncbi:hypothetical protein L596_002519 [Steinernema carpocapsae]|uniref:Uncharacterized protein n=1 Tax=Steinernema carpocapsae TaxID=34508 RepID=A0A4U8URB2_STECR|nr:hypothetical protein L596_002519 [Steinernema carpocapsae]
MQRQSIVSFSTNSPEKIPRDAEIEPESEFLNKLDMMPAPRRFKDERYSIDELTAASVGGTHLFKRNWYPYLRTKNADRWTVLMYAACMGHVDLCCWLLRFDPMLLRERDTVGRSPLMLAAGCGHSLIVRHFLQYPAGVNIRDKAGHSSLHYAVANRQESVLDILLDLGGDPNLRDKKGFTPTLLACSLGNARMLEALILFGGDVFQKNCRLEDGMILAQENYYGSACMELIENYAFVHSKQYIVNDLEYLLRFFNLAHTANTFFQYGITMQTFLTLNSDYIYKMGFDSDTAAHLNMVIQYFTPYGVTPYMNDPQKEYTIFFRQHAMQVQHQINMYYAALKQKEAYLLQLAYILK